MADHNKPLSSSTYANFVTELDARLDDLTVGLDPAVTTPINLAVNAIRWSSASAKWQKWNGTVWGDLSALYGINISGNAATVTNGVYTNVSYADPAWITTIAGSKVNGDITGKAGTATKLATPRNINGVAFDGSAAIDVNVNNSLTFNNAGAGAASGTTFNGSAVRTISYNTVGAPSTTGANASGTWDISISGNANTATSAGGLTLASFSQVYPVGSIYINADNNANPGVLLGFGTWVAFAAGRVMIGDGGSFSAGVTGGSADAVIPSHTHTATVTDPGHNHQYKTYGLVNSGLIGNAYTNYDWGYAQTDTKVTGITVSNSTTGVSATNANLQPYIVVYMWRRTA